MNDFTQRRTRKRWALGTAGALLFGVMITPAQAYIDWGTGSMILQAVVAGFLGALFMIKNFWSRIKSFFTGNRSNESSVDE